MWRWGCSLPSPTTRLAAARARLWPKRVGQLCVCRDHFFRLGAWWALLGCQSELSVGLSGSRGTLWVTFHTHVASTGWAPSTLLAHNTDPCCLQELIQTIVPEKRNIEAVAKKRGKTREAEAQSKHQTRPAYTEFVRAKPASPGPLDPLTAANCFSPWRRWLDKECGRCCEHSATRALQPPSPTSVGLIPFLHIRRQHIGDVPRRRGSTCARCAGTSGPDKSKAGRRPIRNCPSAPLRPANSGAMMRRSAASPWRSASTIAAKSHPPVAAAIAAAIAAAAFLCSPN
ncbi:hypothetical protein B0T16DRAFT_423363 [Cercophora newfieldiana]|uniref:Uncharacterized protein n=1 Tax=Cercophora newfieldiana TaxID=92897 RepID=A0AA40CIF8_9PEZI|nr:hypothetical protein B0T16DRAFT_423363 [Cercophora newfieldiana]